VVRHVRAFLRHFTHGMLEAIHQLASRSMEDALRSFEAVLKEKPTNLIALLGKARICGGNHYLR
jgi:hypothetical protein